MKDGADRSILIEMQYTAKNIPDTEREFSWTQRGKTEGLGTHHRQGRSRGCKRWHDRVACELRRGAAARTLERGEREGGGDQGKRWGKWRDIKKAERERRGELRQRLRLLNNLWGDQYIARGLCTPWFELFQLVFDALPTPVLVVRASIFPHKSSSIACGAV